MRSVDLLIIGSGLAGSCLAWQAHLAGRSILIIDDADTTSASRHAAGLMTPITGRRLAYSREYQGGWAIAVPFYERIEILTQQRFLHQAPAVRLFQWQDEIDAFQRRSADWPAIPLNPLDTPSTVMFRAERGGFVMPGAARLDVPTFLNATATFFQARGEFRAERYDPDGLTLQNQQIAYEPENLAPEAIVFCQGVRTRENPLFAEILDEPTNGEYWRIAAPGCLEHRVIHRGLWMVPAGHEQFLVGATYDRANRRGGITPAGQEQLQKQFDQLFQGHYKVLERHGAVRPIHTSRRGAILPHPSHPKIYAMNRLGSKGALMAPVLAAEWMERFYCRAA
ncbi:MAG: NAD(P)/FAD-dependent oxidoreductase [Gemmataceae bacterium]